MESRLDSLLELTRQPLPRDDLFVAKVMASARADRRRRGRLARRFTGPAAIAAAAVIAIGGGVAALVRSTSEPPGSAAQNVLTQPKTGETSDESVPSVVEQALPSVRVPASDEPQRTFKRGDREWGYTSKTRAFAVDHETGLRLDTEVYRTQFDTDVPQQVTLTLRNDGDRPVAVEAPEGCAMMIGVYPADGTDAEAYPWRCATPTDGSQGSRFVLQPGQRRSADATVVLGATGDFGLVGMCRCTYASAAPSSPTPQPNPLEDLPLMSAQFPLRPTPEEPAASDDGSLVTPPIRVQVS